MRSYDSSQMHNGGAGAGAAACEPFQYQNFEANASLPNNGAITPCGQIAYSNFNDSYTMQLVAPGGAVSTIALDVSGPLGGAGQAWDLGLRTSPGFELTHLC